MRGTTPYGTPTAKQHMRGPESSALSGYIAVALWKVDQAFADVSPALVDAPGECDVALAP